LDPALAALPARLNGAIPGLVQDLLAIANRLLPAGTADRASVLTAADIEIDSGPVSKALTILGRRAAERLNKLRTPPSSP
jgi:hypothetical protein